MRGTAALSSVAAFERINGKYFFPDTEGKPARYTQSHLRVAPSGLIKGDSSKTKQCSPASPASPGLENTSVPRY